MSPRRIGILAGKGLYAPTFIAAAKLQQPQPELILAAFHDETDPRLEDEVTASDWFRVGQLGKLIKFFKKHEVTEAIMVGQISPSNLFNLRPDLRTIGMLAKLKRRNAETIFGAIGDELAKDGITLLPATTFLEDHLPGAGHFCGPNIKAADEADIDYAFQLAKKTSALDIGQCVVVRRGTVIAVEAFEGTNDCLRRAGELGKHKEMTLGKVSKPNQDLRFDVPVIGPDTIRNATAAGIQNIAFEAGMTLILGEEEVKDLCRRNKISLVGVREQ